MYMLMHHKWDKYCLIQAEVRIYIGAAGLSRIFCTIRERAVPFACCKFTARMSRHYVNRWRNVRECSARKLAVGGVLILRLLSLMQYVRRFAVVPLPSILFVHIGDPASSVSVYILGAYFREASFSSRFYVLPSFLDACIFTTTQPTATRTQVLKTAHLAPLLLL